MRIERWSVLLLLAGLCMSSTSARSGRQPRQQQTAQQSSDQTRDQKENQSHDDMLAEAARRAREQKKQEPKAAKVWDNDNIPTKPGSISIIGESGSLSQASAVPAADRAESPSNTTAAANAEKGAGSEASGATDVEQQKTEITKQLEKAKERLQSVSTDLDILSRKYTLDQQMYYGKPDYSSDTEGAAALKAEEGQIASKKQEVADAQKQVDDLTAKLKELESEGSNRPTNTPQ